jgi:phosphoribosylformylglycinamidine (FGAM) synthase PurS component
VKVSTYKGAEALALEMSVDEQAEVRELERQWKDAEEIADIADNLLVDPTIEDALRHLKEGDQPPG